MLRKFTSRLSKYRTNNVYDMYSSQACTVTIDADTLTAMIETSAILTATVSPSGTYDVNFKYGDILINPVPIPTDINGIATLSLDTTDLTAGLYNITAEVVNPTPQLPELCISSPITLALTTTVCGGISITNPPSPVTAYIGDIIPVSISATITEPSVVELRLTEFDMRVGSCVLDNSGNCIINADTTDAPPGTYHVAAYIGYGLAEQCISSPVEVTLQERPGKIIVLAIPPGARIYLGGVDTGVNASAIISDISINVPHTVELTLPGYENFTRTFTMTRSEETTLITAIMIPTIPPVGTGNLNVTSTPSEAEFYIYSETDEIASGITPTLTPFTDIPVGIYGYGAGIVSNGTSEVMGSVTIKVGETTNLHIPLPPYSPDNGMIAIESIPVGADIYIDGEPINAKTSYAAMMSPGPHTYELRMSGYQNKSGEFTVVTGYDMPTIVSDVLQPSGTGTAMVFVIVGIAALGMMMIAPSSVGIKEEGVK